VEQYHKHRLWLRIAIPFLLFVATGSIAMVLWMRHHAQLELQARFRSLAETTAGFIRSSRIQPSERLARELSHLLGMQIYFRNSAGDLEPPPPSGQLQRLRDLRTNELVTLPGPLETLAVPVDAAHDLLLVRQAEKAAVFSTGTAVLLGCFWGLSLVLGWLLTRSLVHPLWLLARGLPQIDKDAIPELPGLDRDDEIGLLARTYLETHKQLLSERRQREAAEKLALLGKMAAGLAHEIHNPLSAIKMHLQLLQSTPVAQTADVAAETLPVVLGEASRIESLVNQWMFLAKPAPPLCSPLELGALVTEAVRAIQPQADHAGVKITLLLTEKLFVKADATRLRQVIGNLLLNAVQAMPEGGEVEITGANSAMVSLVFRDHGRGFSPEALRSCTELFYSEKEGGMGMGLSVCMEVIKAHGGRMEISNHQNGAEVKLLLPRLEE
jgi:signal transduction histidine kinase